MSLARVTVTHRRLLHVRCADGREAVARPARRELSIVCGDFVRCQLDQHHGELNVVAVEPRSSALYRTNARGGSELIAANVSLLLVVAAEMSGAQQGIGAFVLMAGSLMQTDQLLAGVVMLSVLGLLIAWGLGMLERRMLKWR